MDTTPRHQSGQFDWQPDPNAVGSLFEQFGEIAIYLADPDQDRERAKRRARARIKKIREARQRELRQWFPPTRGQG